ncbi:MAG: nucleotidyltransferase domain-containing protein [Spirochaetia bacterium]
MPGKLPVQLFFLKQTEGEQKRGALFGLTARGHARPDSDVDLLLEFDAFMDAADILEDIFPSTKSLRRTDTEVLQVNTPLPGSLIVTFRLATDK